MANNTLPLSIVANVAVNVSPVAAATPTFNQGLIVGSSSVIPSATGSNPRIRKYSTLAAMATDGFTTSMPEYLAAQLYFSQVPSPTYVWIGRQDLTATETPLAALQACRAAATDWWACVVTTAVTADHAAIAAWIEAITPASCYFYTTGDSQVLANTAGNVFLSLQTGAYKRSIGVYSTSQAGAAPNNIYAAAAAMGCAMGLNTGLANSNFTMKFKQLTGIATEPLTQTQVANMEASNGNVYLSYGNTYSWLEQGVMASGQYLDEVLNLDMFASDIQYSLANLLISQPAIPHTNAGQAQIIATVNQACQRALDRGFIAPGVWTGQTVLNVASGTPLPRGFLCQSDTFQKQSASDRQLRKAMPVYVTFIEAGAMHSITVGVYVQR
jgi:Protein of unknown function (DUF3383)